MKNMSTAVCNILASPHHCMMAEYLMPGPEMDDPFYGDSLPTDLKSSSSSSLMITTMTSLNEKSYTQLDCPVNRITKTQYKRQIITYPGSNLVTEDINLQSWEKTHPEQWTSEDVLNLIYFIAYKSNDIEVSSLHGEKFQNVRGSDLCSMTEEDFLCRDPKHGRLLYECIQNLLQKSQFLPPEGIVDIKVAEFTDLKSRHKDIPKPVEDFTFDDEDLFGGCEQNVINMFGVSYDIDSSADFCNIQPELDMALASYPPPTTTEAYMEVERNMDDEAAAFYESGYGYHHQVYETYHQGHDHRVPQSQQQQQQRQQQHQKLEQNYDHEQHLLGGGSLLPIDLRSKHELGQRSGRQQHWAANNRIHPKVIRTSDKTMEKMTKRRRNKSISSDGETSTDKGSSRSSHDIFSSKSYNVSGGKGNHLWEFLCQLLRNNESTHFKDRLIQWESREEGVFRIIDSKEVANLWGKHKNNDNMTYEKLSRALRWCRTYGFLAALPKDGKFPKKLCFRFGPRATNWRRYV